MWIRLTRKLAQCLDGIDVSQYEVGDVFELTRGEGELLIAEGWAEPHARVSTRVYQPRKASTEQRVAEAPAVDNEPVWSATHTLDQLREIRLRLEDRIHAASELRRAEDRIREELRETRAQVIYPGQSQHR
jgi:TolA-binding protein